MILFLSITQIAYARPLKVFVSILPQKYFVEKIGGDSVEVAVMVLPGASPATYEPKPKQMVALAKSDSILGNSSKPIRPLLTYPKVTRSTAAPMESVR